MTCPELFKLSLLMDEELSESEEAQLRTHLPDCPQCSSAWQDFTALRGEMRALTAQAGRNTDQALERVLAPAGSGFWRRRIAVPAPLAAAATVLVLALAVWAGMLQTNRSGGGAGREALTPDQLAPGPLQAGGIDFARYDRGGRPLIFKQAKPASLRR